MKCCLFLLFAILGWFTVGACGEGLDSQKSLPGLAHSDEAKEIDFIMYLMARGDLNEALFLLDEVSGSTVSLADSVFYLKGWAFYQQKALLPSANSFLQVSQASLLYPKSRLFGAYNLAHAGKLEQAKKAIGELQTDNEALLSALKNLQQSGIALLERDFHSFTVLSDRFSGRFHVLTTQEQSMIRHHDVLMTPSRRSPLVAGMLSAVVPGLGKMYAGKKGEGVAGMLYTLAFGATAYDFYRGGGPRSAMFIVSSSIAAIFYIGNIWGSVTAVHRKNREFNHEIDQRILFDMHIPLRNAYN